MTRISRRYLHKDLEERLHEVLWEHVARLNTPSLIKEFFQSILSSTEQVMIAKRLAIALLIAKGYTHEEIDESLKVSLSTISAIHRQVLSGAPGYARAIELTRKQKSKEAFWDGIEEILLKTSLPARYGSAKHQLKSDIGKELYKRKRQRDFL